MYLQKKKVFKAKLLSKKGCAALLNVPHEVPAKVFKTKVKQGKVIPQEEKKKRKEEEELQRSFANCLRRSAVKIARQIQTSYSVGPSNFGTVFSKGVKFARTVDLQYLL